MRPDSIGRCPLWVAILLLAVTAAAAPPPPDGPHATLACAACHGEETPAAAPSPRACTASCHEDVAAALLSSEHDARHMVGSIEPPTCAACHGGHRLRSGPNARVAAAQQGLSRTCTSCHDPARYGDAGLGLTPTAEPGAIHSSCFTCHWSHTTLPASDPAAPIARELASSTCGSCHEHERGQWAQGSHGTSTNAAAPTCVSCHGGHSTALTRAALPDGQSDAVLACVECHEDSALIRHSTLPFEAVEGYERTFHGRLHDHGMIGVATCVSCHGSHAVLPASDPRSPVHAAAIEGTCRSCHSTVDAEMLAAVRHSSQPISVSSFLDRFRLYFPVAGTAVNGLMISGLGALVGFLSGLFGVGGGFLMTPLLIFIGIPAAVAAATDAAQITAGATSGALSHSRLGNVDFKMGLVIVAGGWTGGIAGVQLVKLLRNLGNFDFFLKLVYVLVLGFIGITMLLEGVRAWRGRSGASEPGRSRLSSFFGRLPFQMEFQRSGLRTSVLLPVGAGFLVGVLAAFLGVGGGFIMLPTMIYIIGIPTRVAVGTDLFQIVLTSANVGFQQALVNHTVDIMLAVMLFLGSVIGAQFGVRASRHLRGEQIRVFLALIVMAVMAILLVQLVSTPDHLIDFARSGGGH